MEQRLSLVTLGVRDLEMSRRFYEALGWRAEGSPPGVVFFQLQGLVFGLFGWDDLAKDATVPPAGAGFRGLSLAYNARSREEVDAVMAEAVAAGARLVKAPHEVFWGGYSGYFADPDEHLWEVAHNPGWVIEPDGRIRVA
ncbi:MAG: VOC family protein [Bauldia sp.]|nr:VOC family protein [Bauldia sp.]